MQFTSDSATAMFCKITCEPFTVSDLGLSPWLFVPVQDIKSGQSPLMYAVERNNVDIVQFLIEVMSMCVMVPVSVCVCVCVCDDECTACLLESAYFCFMARRLCSTTHTAPLFPEVSLSLSKLMSTLCSCNLLCDFTSS